jgi:2,4-dienoyl-CoA reductase-like NADH-dependent reductase (Old Yellow Enzyme family)
LGIFSDALNAGHKRLAAAIKETGSLAVIQIFHAGIRSPQELVPGGPVAPSAHEKSGSRALTLAEVHELRDNFIAAAIRAKESGYDGVELHGAHGYILCQFLSSKYNFRNDEYGGSLENRARLTFEIINGIREACGPQFLLGLRLSPDRFGMQLAEIKTISQQLISEGKVDFLDISLWDCFKEPEEAEYKGTTLLEHFTAMDYGHVRLTVAGKIYSAAEARKVMEAGVDFVTIGRAAILHHDFPRQVERDPAFETVELPVSRDYLRNQGLGEQFLEYMGNWPGFMEG